MSGLQFNLNGVSYDSGDINLIETYGGDLQGLGWTSYCAGQTCLIFSFTGATLPAGSGTLATLSFDESVNGIDLLLADIVVSSTTVPSDLSPSATTIVEAVPPAIILAGEQPILFNIRKGITHYLSARKRHFFSI